MLKVTPMSTENRLFSDLSRMTEGAFNALSGAKSEFDTMMRQRFERFLESMNLVTREEFEAAAALAQRAREGEEALAERVAALEARVALLDGGKKPAPKPRARRKPAAKKTAAAPVADAASPETGDTGVA